MKKEDKENLKFLAVLGGIILGSGAALGTLLVLSSPDKNPAEIVASYTFSTVFCAIMGFCFVKGID